MPLAASIGEADHASNCMGMWARMLLGQQNPSPAAKGVPPKATSGTTTLTPIAEPTAPAAEPAPEEVDEDGDSDEGLTAEERAEVARIEEECSALERRMRDLSVTTTTSKKKNARCSCLQPRLWGYRTQVQEPERVGIAVSWTGVAQVKAVDIILGPCECKERTLAFTKIRPSRIAMLDTQQKHLTLQPGVVVKHPLQSLQQHG